MAADIETLTTELEHVRWLLEHTTTKHDHFRNQLETEGMNLDRQIKTSLAKKWYAKHGWTANA